MTWAVIRDLIDLTLLSYIAWLERKAVDLDKANHALYSVYFAERTRWYAARGKRKALEEEMQPEVPANLLVLSTEADDVERGADELSEDDSSQQGTGPRHTLAGEEPGEQPQRHSDGDG